MKTLSYVHYYTDEGNFEDIRRSQLQFAIYQIFLESKNGQNGLRMINVWIKPLLLVIKCSWNHLFTKRKWAFYRRVDFKYLLYIFLDDDLVILSRQDFHFELDMACIAYLETYYWFLIKSVNNSATRPLKCKLENEGNGKTFY